MLPVRRVPEVARVRMLARLVERSPGAAAHGPATPRPGNGQLPGTGPAPELDPLTWELAMTADWATRRVLAAFGLAPAGHAAWAGEGTVLSLLPGQDITVHVIRRALPFALCGIPVRVAGHDHQDEKLGRYVSLLSHLLGLPGGVLTVSGLPAGDAVTQCQEEDLIVVTGQASAVSAVRQASPATVIGGPRSGLSRVRHDATDASPAPAAEPQQGWPGDFQV